MKKLTNILFSMVTTIVLLGLFAAAIGYATFAENANGTPYARELVYNAGWFELLLILLIVNMIGSAVRYKLTNRRKFTVMLFHLSFIIILIGAGITRYFGSEGMLHLRNGQTSNEITSDKSTVRIIAEYNGQKTEKSFDASFGPESSNEFSQTIEVGDKSVIVESELFMPNAIESIEADENGEPAFNLFVMDGNGSSRELILTPGETAEVADTRFAFADSSIKADINITMDGEQLNMQAHQPVSQMSMMEAKETAIVPGTLLPLQQRTIYKTGNLTFVMKKFLTKARKTVAPYDPSSNKMAVMMKPKNAVVFHLSDGQTMKKVNVLSAENEASAPATCLLNDMKVSVEYGSLPQKLPFSITLRKFDLERYPGSMSPSSYASEITVVDKENNVNMPYRIFMNNILNYRGYRFFQSSYDNDEQGTVLSVNHDYWGTLITYVGYLLMLIGMVMTLFNRNSRFHTVIRLSNSLSEKRKASRTLMLAALLAGSASIMAVEKPANRNDHFNALSSLLIQDDAQGRIEPISTYASDVIRKITKKTSWKDQSALEVFISMCSNPGKWENEAVIKVGHDEMARELGAVDGYVSFAQLVDFAHGGTYKLADKVNNAYQKDPSQRNQYEKELLNVDERLNILNSIFNGEMLRIFPDKKNPLGKWILATPAMSQAAMPVAESMMGGAVCPVSGSTGKTDKPANMDKDGAMGTAMGSDMSGNMSGDKCPVTGQTGKAGKLTEADMQAMTTDSGATCPACGNPHADSSEGISGMAMPMGTDDVSSPATLLGNYFAAVEDAYKSGDWSQANAALLVLKNYQQLNGGDQLPSRSRINMEVLYNKLSIFLTLAILYGLIGMLLIGLHLFNILKYNPKIEKYLSFSIYPLGLMFVIYTAGLALRWYISGHAPWSNGYEAMIFVGWGTTLAGLVFASRNPITLAITSLLAATALSVAGMSWMNPEITPLVPVLKSYWLVVHVAVITSSYGFLATGAMLGLFNLFLMIFRNPKNLSKINDNIQEFSYIIELTLTIGLFMLTVGTFLGGVWANESWGRYWGWDSKETWALVSVLVYSLVLHLRKIPACNNLLVFNVASVVSISSVIMTFVGVNYYLSGMHSYGQGTPPPVPAWVYVAILFVGVIIIGAIASESKLKPAKSPSEESEKTSKENNE